MPLRKKTNRPNQVEAHTLSETMHRGLPVYSAGHTVHYTQAQVAEVLLYKQATNFRQRNIASNAKVAGPMAQKDVLATIMQQCKSTIMREKKISQANGLDMLILQQ